MISQRTHLKLCVEKERTRDQNGEEQRSNGHSQALTYGLNTYCWFHIIVNLVEQPRKDICYFVAYMRKKTHKSGRNLNTGGMLDEEESIESDEGD